jgi:DNA-binding transcriptional MerR regulator
MEPIRASLLPIGTFASLTRLSVKALRLYAQLGLLVPVYVDPDSSYRYYHPGQLQQARLIRLMRAIDMPLATIRLLLAAPPAEAEQLAQAYVRELEERAALARRLVPNLIASLHGEAAMTDLNVTVREAEAQPVLSITSRVKVDQLVPRIQESLAQLHAEAGRLGVTPAGAPFGLYHEPINHEEDGPIEVCLPVSRRLQAAAPVESKELPATRLAVAELRGEQCSFPAVLQGYDATHDWISRQGFVHAGPPREVWLVAPADTNPDDHMEIAWPFREGER